MSDNKLPHYDVARYFCTVNDKLMILITQIIDLTLLYIIC